MIHAAMALMVSCRSRAVRRCNASVVMPNSAVVVLDLNFGRLPGPGALIFAKRSDIRKTECTLQECTPNAERSRGDGSCWCRRGMTKVPTARPVQHDSENRRQMGRLLPCGRGGWFA